MDDLTVTPARPDDLPAMLSLYSQLHADESPPPADRVGPVWARLMESRETTVLLARRGGAAVGTCMLTIVPNLTRGGRSYAIVENVVTDAAFRRQGIGRAVLASALDRAWDAGCYKVMLATGSRREETLRFYERAGLTRGGKTYFEARRPQGEGTSCR